MNEDLMLELFRDLFNCIIKLSYNNPKACSKIGGDAVRKIDAILMAGKTPKPEQQQWDQQLADRVMPKPKQQQPMTDEERIAYRAKGF